ncbi:MAG: CopD family protein [Robiginitomaculum sp.]|nr:CopD family protein [Robiginitomaculum sp.]
MHFLYAKAVHIIFVVTWFAGLFYSVRLFIYFAEAEKKPETEKTILQNQYKTMSKRLWYIITWPSAVIVALSALYMLTQTPDVLKMPWLQVKLAFVGLLYLYHFKCHSIYSQLQKGLIQYSPTKLRIWNEVATVLLFAIVFLVVLKSAISWVYGVVGLLALSFVLMFAVKTYKRGREKQQ